jgi:hypothetical protein
VYVARRAADAAAKAGGGLRRSRTQARRGAQDGVTKEQRLAAVRAFDIVMKHGHKTIDKCHSLAEDGHQIMANVLMTMEMLHIQREACGERLRCLDDEHFEEMCALFEATAEVESSLRHHNGMKMSVYGALSRGQITCFGSDPMAAPRSDRGL